MEKENSIKMHGTTIVAVRKDGRVAFAGDGQVSMGNMVMKGTAKKVMKIAHGKVIAGFAGSVADSFTLLERFEEKLEKYNANLSRAAMELARDWRTDKFLRKLEALLLVADKEHLFLVSGTGEVIEPDEEVAAIGSGGPMALAAARALIQHSSLSAEEIAKESIKIAASICVFTNDQITIEVLE